jgi:hypothetical protein
MLFLEKRRSEPVAESVPDQGSVLWIRFVNNFNELTVFNAWNFSGFASAAG